MMNKLNELKALVDDYNNYLDPDNPVITVNSMNLRMRTVPNHPIVKKMLSDFISELRCHYTRLCITNLKKLKVYSINEFPAELDELATLTAVMDTYLTESVMGSSYRLVKLPYHYDTEIQAVNNLIADMAMIYSQIIYSKIQEMINDLTG